MPKLPSEQRRALMTAMLDAFPDQDALGTMAFMYLDHDLGAFGGRYTATPVLVQNMIVAAEARNTVNRLIAAARAAAPSNPLVASLSDQLAPAAAPSGGFEVLINKRNRAMDVRVLLSRLSTLEGQVGRVEAAGRPKPIALGTAFLVGPDVVLTNDHIIQQFAKRNIPLSRGCVRFDYALLSDGVSQSPGRVVPFAADPIVDHSPVDQYDTVIEPMHDADPAHLDFALVRLAEAVGDQPRGDVAAGALKRGWVQHTAALPPLDDPLWIMQHPDGDTVKLAFSEKAITRVNANQTRFRHRVNTRPGSSGSPCFNYSLELVGLHHYGDEQAATPYNQAVPIKRIADHIGLGASISIG